MNSFLLNLSPVKDVKIKEENYGKEIYEAILKLFPEIENGKIRVSSFFGYFFENEFILKNEENYKIMITIKDSNLFVEIIQKLFRKALQKERFLLNENEFIIKGIISNDKIWTGYFNFDEIMKMEEIKLDNKLLVKVVNPIIRDIEKIDFVYGFNNIFSIIIKSFEEYFDKKKLDLSEEEIRNSIKVKREKYYIKNLKLNSEIKKSYLGEIELEILNREYKNLIYSLLKFAQFYGIGEMSEYGFGQILIK